MLKSMFYNFKSQEKIMKKILLLLTTLMLFPSMSNADCSLSDFGVYIDLNWVAADQRKDGTALLPEEIAGYSIYHKDKTDNTSCVTTIMDGTAISHRLDILKDTPYDINITTLDTDGRESSYSPTIVVGGIAPIPVIRPNPVSEFSVSNEIGTYNYTFAWLDPTHFEDGTILPSRSITKHFLFDNNVWVQDIQVGIASLYLPLSIGEHLFEIETEVSVNGKLVTSNRSLAVPVSVLSIPNPPSNVQFVIPDGFKANVTISPVN
jgi:hypothetical protein